MAVLLEDIVQSVEMWLKLIKKPQPYVDPNLDPVLLVPGIAGSILTAVDDKNGKEERVWVRILGADYKFRTKLWSRFDPSTGRTVSLDEGSRIVVPEDRYGLYAIDVLDPDMIIGRDCVYYFHDMIEEMIKWGFQEGKTLFGFGYDFRQSNRLQDTMDRLAAKLESVYNASGGKKISIISHSMGGLLVKCFMGLHSDIFEKYVKNWIAIAAPFRGAPGYIASTFLNGMSFVDGWEQNFFISKWSMHQLLIECPSVYELMACPHFQWEHVPLLELWREKQDCSGYSRTILESYGPGESIEIFKQALKGNWIDYNGESIPMPFNLEILEWTKKTRKVLAEAKVPHGVKFYNIYGINLETPHSVCYGSEETPITDLEELRLYEPTYVCCDGDGTVPAESAKADGLHAEARVGVPGEHRGILCEPHVFRILKHWLKAGVPDPFYNPVNDYVILPTAFEMESHKEKGLQVTSLKEEWEIVSEDQVDLDDMTSQKPFVSSISVSQGGNKQSSRAEAHATVIVHPQNEGKQHVELNAISVSVDA
ncbi:Lecithin:cholesterol/phospholipid:diacylglycerol acyltransferase [Corchorus olitorius]|uniref:Lecithin:cholesterol/phospholipid:diacylglycerol acyltransferase n=1 Tax=Corchorus olitorius TaxID=93759 RepID=A0A1R3H620_9ROSI|nr:Lecithin:cholesterol/phospholipid:diacylglycerol acyltransferase [Corchorus olitorius]